MPIQTQLHSRFFSNKQAGSLVLAPDQKHKFLPSSTNPKSQSLPYKYNLQNSQKGDNNSFTAQNA